MTCHQRAKEDLKDPNYKPEKEKQNKNKEQKGVNSQKLGKT